MTNLASASYCFSQFGWNEAAQLWDGAGAPRSLHILILRPCTYLFLLVFWIFHWCFRRRACSKYSSLYVFCSCRTWSSRADLAFTHANQDQQPMMAMHCRSMRRTWHHPAHSSESLHFWTVALSSHVCFDMTCSIFESDAGISAEHPTFQCFFCVQSCCFTNILTALSTSAISGLTN